MPELFWKGTGRKWNIRKALDVGIIGLLRMNTRERAELAQFLHVQFVRRAEQFAKAGRVGYALSKLVEDMAEASQKLGINLDPFDPVVEHKNKTRYLAETFANRSNPQNALASYIVLMQDFFNAKSSTVRGWDKIGREQDKRIFRGKYRMNDAERIMFWRVYREITKTEWTGIHDYSSDSQRLFGTKWMSGDFDHLDFDEAYKRMKEMLDERPAFLKEHAQGIEGDPTPQGEGGVEFVW